MEDWSALSCFCSYSSPMESSCTLWRTWVRKVGGKPSRPVVATSLWLSASLFPAFFMYGRPAKTFPIDKSLSVFYTVITPMLNPWLIYTLRKSQMTNAMNKLWRRNMVFYGKKKKCIIHHEGDHLTPETTSVEFSSFLLLMLISFSLFIIII